MQKRIVTESKPTDRLANQMPKSHRILKEPEGALISESTDQDGKIAVLYNGGEPPPEIVIAKTSKQVQTVFANGVAVAVVAQADGPRITNKDILLVECFRGAGA